MPFAGAATTSSVITSVQPEAFAEGSSGNQVVVIGAGFSGSESQIRINGSSSGVTTYYGSSSMLYGTVPDSAVSAEGLVSVKVRNTVSGVDSNTVSVPVTESGTVEGGTEVMMYVIFGIASALAFIGGMGLRWS